jgi:hypothetical protein
MNESETDIQHRIIDLESATCERKINWLALHKQPLADILTIAQTALAPETGLSRSNQIKNSMCRDGEWLPGAFVLKQT